MPSQNEIRERITKTIVESLTSGGLPPWRRPWAADPNAGFPANVVSKKKYRGINPLLLEIAAMRHGLKGKWWATYNQWKELGGQVMKRPDNVPSGEWGTAIIFWKSTWGAARWRRGPYRRPDAHAPSECGRTFLRTC